MFQMMSFRKNCKIKYRSGQKEILKKKFQSNFFFKL